MTHPKNSRDALGEEKKHQMPLNQSPPKRPPSQGEARQAPKMTYKQPLNTDLQPPQLSTNCVTKFAFATKTGMAPSNPNKVNQDNWITVPHFC